MSELKELLFTNFRSLVKNKKFNQVVTLYLVNIIGIPLSIVTSIVLTRFLGPKGYGDYIFLTNIFTFSVTLFTFGLFQAGNRALVLNDDKTKAREYFGVELIILFGLFLIMAIALYIYGVLDPNIEQKGLRGFFFYLIPFGWIFLMVQYFEVLFQADNRINELASTRLFPKVGFFIAATIIYFGFKQFSGNRLAVIWLFYLITYLIVFSWVIIKLKVSLNNFKLRLHEIWNYNKSYGFHVYSGSVFSVGIGALTGVLISYFSLSNTGVGYFGLAMTFASPLAFIPNVIATTHYKDFSKKNKMPRRLIFVTIALSALALLFIWIIVGPFIRFFYGEQFLPVINLNFLVSFGVLLAGFADFFNRFLGAHGKGKALRNSAMIIGIVMLILNLTLIPHFGETGAAYTKIFTGAIYFMLMIFFYKKLLKELKTTS